MDCVGFNCGKNTNDAPLVPEVTQTSTNRRCLEVAINILLLLEAGVQIGMAIYGRDIPILAKLEIMDGMVASGGVLVLIAFFGITKATVLPKASILYLVLLSIHIIAQLSVASVCIVFNKEKQMALATKGWMKANSDKRDYIQTKFNCCGFLDTEGPCAKFRDLVEDRMTNAMNSFNMAGQVELTKAWDTVQMDFNCCGVNSYMDWKDSTANFMVNDLPDSCCKDGSRYEGCAKGQATNPDTTINQQGCVDGFTDWLLAKKNVNVLEGTGIYLAFIQGPKAALIRKHCWEVSSDTSDYLYTEVANIGHPSCAKLDCCKGHLETICCGGPTNSTVTCPCTTTCWSEISKYMNQSIKVVGGFGLFVGFTEMGLLAIGIWITCQTFNQEDPKSDSGQPQNDPKCDHGEDHQDSKADRGQSQNDPQVNHDQSNLENGYI